MFSRLVAMVLARVWISSGGNGEPTKFFSTHRVITFDPDFTLDEK